MNWKKNQDVVVDQIFDIASEIYGYSVYDLAQRTGLAWSTIDRLRGDITQRPQYRTVMLLAESIGMNLSLVEKTLKRRKAA